MVSYPKLQVETFPKKRLMDLLVHYLIGRLFITPITLLHIELGH